MRRARLPCVVLRIPRALLDALHDQARKGVPQEICGLLAGRRDGDAHEVTHVFQVRNAHQRPVGEYLLDPQEQLRTLLHVEDELGLEVVGYYHSHPIGPPRFSATDAARATWPGVSYVLVYLQPEEGHLSARWDPDKGRFQPEDVEVV